MTKNSIIIAFLISSIYSYGQKIKSFKDSRDGQVYSYINLVDDKIINEYGHLAAYDIMIQNLNYEMEGAKELEQGTRDKYGLLYTHEASKNACPTGWKIATLHEWTEIIKFWGRKYGRENFEKAMASTEVWIRNSGSNRSKFNAVPSGVIKHGEIVNTKFVASWWTSSVNPDKEDKPHVILLIDDHPNPRKFKASFGTGDFDDSRSCRCIRDLVQRIK